MLVADAARLASETEEFLLQRRLAAHEHQLGAAVPPPLHDVLPDALNRRLGVMRDVGDGAVRAAAVALGGQAHHQAAPRHRPASATAARSTMYGPMASQSAPSSKKLAMASNGLSTMGSCAVLNDVFTTIGTPVSCQNRSMTS